jgi:HK97 family phage major capsid protein
MNHTTQQTAQLEGSNGVSHLTDVRPSRWQRRLAARKGFNPADLGRVYNRAATGAPGRPDTPVDTDANGPVPRTAGEWEHYLQGLDTPDKFVAAFNDGSFGKALQGYVGAQTKERTDLLSDVRAMAEETMTRWLKENPTVGREVPVDLGPDQKPRARTSAPVYNNPQARGAPLNSIFSNFTEFLQAVWQGDRNTASLETREKLARFHNYSESVPSEGGLLVPEEFRSQLMQLAMERAIVRPRATIIPMANPRVHIPKVDETSRVSTIFGGVVVYRTEEGAELTESAATFASTKLDVTKQTALAHVPNELIRDWGAFGAFIDATLPPAFAWSEDLDYIAGNGAGAPLGALNANNTALITVTRNTTNKITWEDAIGMYQRLLPSSIDSAVWITSPDTFSELATMALVVGTGGSAVWLTDGTGRPVLTLLGLPVIRSEKAPGAKGSLGDISLVDWSMYLLGDYQTMTVDSSPHVKFTSDKTTFRAIARNDGRPWLDSPLTPHNNSATLSPFVTLAA